jgi:hypothetical protein
MDFKLKETLASHKKQCKQSPECVVCGKVFTSGRLLERHFYRLVVKREREREAERF